MLNNGDGLTFFDQVGQLQGTLVNRVAGKLVFPANMSGIHSGVQIRRNADRDFLKQLDQSQPNRRIPLKMRFSDFDDGFQLYAEDGDGNSVIVFQEWEKTPARNIEQARKTLERQLTRLGETIFSCGELKIDLPQLYFLPVSTLNALRRKLVAEMLAERELIYSRWVVEHLPNDAQYPQNSLTFLGNMLNQKAESFYHRHGVGEIEPAAKSGLELQGRRVMTTKHCIKFELGGCPHQEQPTKFDEPLYLVDEDGLRLHLTFNCRECQMEVYFERAGR